MLYANLLLNVLYHIEIEMKIRESCLQTGNFIYKPGISLTKQDFHLQRGSLGLQRGFSGYYLPNKLWKLLIDKGMKKSQLREAVGASKSTFAKLGKNENVTLPVLLNICEYLECDFGDIMEAVPENEV